MSGHFTSHYLAEILRDLFFEESTGAIDLRTPTEAWVRLHFDRGMLYFAEGSAAEDRFDAHLKASGILPPAVVGKLAAAAPSHLEMASRLARTGTLGREALDPVVRALVQGGVLRAFSWTGGTYDFSPAGSTGGFFDPDVLFTFECLLKGIEEMAYFGPLKEVLLGLPGRVRLSRKTFIPVDRLALRAHHGYLISRMDGSMRLDEVAMLLSPEEEAPSLKFLYGLAVLGLLEFDPPLGTGPFSLRELMQEHHNAAQREEREGVLIRETAARIVGQSPAEILGVPQGTGLAAARAALDQARATFRKERFSERVREKHKRELGLIESKLAEAFLTLQVERLEKTGPAAAADMPLSGIDPDELIVRREMVKTEVQAAKEETARLSERYFQKARDYFREKDFHNCLQFCQIAIRCNAEMAPAYALMAEVLAKNPNARWQKMAEDAWQRACELDPWNADYCAALGTFYQSQGLEIRARRQFEKALEILPSHPVARAAMKGGGRR